MEARIKKGGKVFKGKIAEILVSKGIAKKIEKNETINNDVPVKKQRTKKATVKKQPE